MTARCAADSLHGLAPLLAAVTMAEEISRDVSARQSAIAPKPLGAALKRQSWQEHAHVAVFRGARQCLSHDAAAPAPVRRALERYAARLHADIDGHHLAASMVGLQCVLEGLAAVALQPPPGALAMAAERYVPMRSLILHQEHGHQRLGEIWIPRLAAPASLRTAVQTYTELADDVLQAGLATLECLAADRAYYGRAVRAHLESAMSSQTAPQPRAGGDLGSGIPGGTNRA